MIDAFAKTRLAGHGRRERAGLEADPGLPRVSTPCPRRLVADFQRAAAIRDAFFPNGASSPQASLDVCCCGAVDAGVTDVQY